MNVWQKSLLAGFGMAVLQFLVSQQLLSMGRHKYTARYKISFKSLDQKPVQPRIKQAINLLSKRFETARYTYQIQQPDDSSIAINLSAITDTAQCRNMLNFSNRIQFRDIYNTSDLSAMFAAAGEAAKQMQPAPKKEKETEMSDEKISKEVRELMDTMGLNNGKETSTGFLSLVEPAPGTTHIGKVAIKDTALVDAILRSPKVIQTAPADIQYLFGPATSNFNHQSKNNEKELYLYAIRTYGSPQKALLENEDIESASVEYDQNGEPIVRMEFNKEGAIKWAAITRRNVGKGIAIIVNNWVISAPVVESAMEGGHVRLSGNYTIEECMDLATRLSSSWIPVKFSITDSRVKPEKTPLLFRNLLITLFTFILFSGIAFLVFNALKPVPATTISGRSKTP